MSWTEQAVQGSGFTSCMRTAPLWASRAVALALGLGLLGACTRPVDEEQQVPPEAPFDGADHHMHLSTPTGAAHLDSVGVVVGERSPDDPASVPRTAADAIAALDHAEVGRGLVLSNAYMFGMPDAPVDDEEALVRAENDHVLAEAARYPGRLRALCSANPLKAYAVAEVERCGADSRAGGLKLHMANSDVSLRDPDHVELVRSVFAAADGAGLPILIHLRTREPEYGAQDVQAFLSGVLPAATRVPVQIAHMAGWGGYDDATHQALSAFAEALSDGGANPNQLTFGLGAVVFDPGAAGADTAMADMVRSANGRLAAVIRDIGVDKVVYATDWPSWPPGVEPVEGVALNRALIRRELPLEETEIDQILENVGPIFTWVRE